MKNPLSKPIPAFLAGVTLTASLAGVLVSDSLGEKEQWWRDRGMSRNLLNG